MLKIASLARAVVAPFRTATARAPSVPTAHFSGARLLQVTNRATGATLVKPAASTAPPMFSLAMGVGIIVTGMRNTLPSAAPAPGTPASLAAAHAPAQAPLPGTTSTPARGAGHDALPDDGWDSDPYECETLTAEALRIEEARSARWDREQAAYGLAVSPRRGPHLTRPGNPPPLPPKPPGLTAGHAGRAPATPPRLPSLEQRFGHLFPPLESLGQPRPALRRMET